MSAFAAVLAFGLFIGLAMSFFVACVKASSLVSGVGGSAVALVVIFIYRSPVRGMRAAGVESAAALLGGSAVAFAGGFLLYLALSRSGVVDKGAKILDELP